MNTLREQTMTRSSLRASVVCAFALFLASCDGVAEPTTAPADARLSIMSRATPRLVVCPTRNELSASAVVGAGGGRFRVGGHAVVIPAGAITEPVELTVTAPAGRHLALDVSAAGSEHYTFQRPIAITLDFSRCQRRDLRAGAMTVWYLDADGTPRERMPVRSGSGSSLTFSTDHLSTYALAY
jgi:hypothetical protein